MELIQEKDMILSDGKKYTGWGYFKDGNFVPQGCGKKFFEGYYTYGNFKDGVVDGPAVVSHNYYMYSMQFKNNQGNGWGLLINRGQLSEFGYYENSRLKVDLTDYALWYFAEMQRSDRDEDMLNVYTFKTTHEISEILIGYKGALVQNGFGLYFMGFHFMADGSIWMGTTQTHCFSGLLIHFCADGKIDCGLFGDGELLQSMDIQEILDEYFAVGAPKLIREQFRNIEPLKLEHNYFEGVPTSSSVANSIFVNKYSMPYHVREIDFNADGRFQNIDKETWAIGDKFIVTPHGTLKIEDAKFIESGPLVGVNFSVSGILKLSDFSCSEGWEDDAEIATFLLVRQPQNVWLWVYAFDEAGTPLVNFCGHDDLDAFANFLPFLERIYQPL